MLAYSRLGCANDSYWIFTIVKGNIALYTTIPSLEVDDDLVTHIQQESGPVQNMNKETLGAMLTDNEDAYKLFLKKKITKAVKKYNRSDN